MAVPKQKISKSKRGMKRGSNGSYSIKIANVLTDKTTGGLKLPHHISLDGYYNGRKVVEEKVKEAPQEE